jgi:2-C-methyl-D-erythritol 4-phosphate cytidylyltransferase
VWAIVVAGGTGRRFGGLKQFLPLAGLPVAHWSVRDARAVADGVVLVVPGDRIPDADDGLPVPGASGDAALGADQVVAGGATRAASVRAGLGAVPDDAAVIVVHDAARPLAGAAVFGAVVDAVRAGGVDGVVPVVPVADTLKRVAGDRVVATVDRADLVAVQTPQAFVAGALRSAHRSGDDASDDAGLLEAEGLVVGTVPGDPRNLKLTRPEDLAMAEALLHGADR